MKNSDPIEIPIRPKTDENTSPNRNPKDETKTNKRINLEKRVLAELEADKQHRPPAVVRTKGKITFWQEIDCESPKTDNLFVMDM